MAPQESDKQKWLILLKPTNQDSVSFIVNLRKLKLFWILSDIKENFIFYNCLLASIKTTIFPPEIKFFLIHMLSTNLIIQNIGKYW